MFPLCSNCFTYYTRSTHLATQDTPLSLALALSQREFLAPLTVLFPYDFGAASCLKGTADFLRKQDFTDKLSANTLLATVDVTSLYANIPYKNGL